MTQGTAFLIYSAIGLSVVAGTMLVVDCVDWLMHGGLMLPSCVIRSCTKDVYDDCSS